MKAYHLAVVTRCGSVQHRFGSPFEKMMLYLREEVSCEQADGVVLLESFVAFAEVPTVIATECPVEYSTDVGRIRPCSDETTTDT